MPISPDECAHEVLDVVPLVMRTIRTEMRSHRAPGLTVPQFRVLVFLARNDGASLSDVAGHLGLTPPSTSVMVDGLVTRGLVTRRPDSRDRRRLTLALTSEGHAAMESARKFTRDCLAERLEALPESERATVVRAMQLLRPIFVSGKAEETDSEK